MSQAVQWYRNYQAGLTEKKTLRIGGFAGTGKTSSLREVVDRLRSQRIHVAAPTGKAAIVLTQAGVPATTIHSHIYYPYEDEKGVVKFQLRQELPDDLIIVDEASMVNRAIYDDLMSFDKPVLFVGDMGQLEPVGKDPHLMRDPDLKLVTVHRQALESDIIRFSMEIRKGKKPGDFRPQKDDVYIGSLSDALEYMVPEHQIICGFNKTRAEMNKLIREEVLDFEGKVCVGDRLICLQNNRTFNIFNGQSFEVQEILKRHDNVIWVRGVEDTGANKELPISEQQLGKPKLLTEEEEETSQFDLVYMDYGYAISCHKAQGSQFDSVLVYEQIATRLWQPKRWRYTAITRAANQLTYLC